MNSIHFVLIHCGCKWCLSMFNHLVVCHFQLFINGSFIHSLTYLNTLWITGVGWQVIYMHVLKMKICHYLQSCQMMFIVVCTVPVLIRPLSEVNTNAEESIAEEAGESRAELKAWKRLPQCLQSSTAEMNHCQHMNHFKLKWLSYYLKG